ncbi:MAG: 50S ribosome-binding GTPase [Synergistaceae bacterium]|nr:50S ribosome-binding GTPase [Synergistaceae bacterium]
MTLCESLDLVLEVCDARAPMLTMSPLSKDFPKSLSVWTVMSKADLANSEITSRWVKYFKNLGRSAWALDLRRKLPDSFKKSISDLSPPNSANKVYRDTRVAVVGTPNVGKSMLLNRLVGRRATPVGGIPGVTKGVLWFSGPGCIVADSPGILNPHEDASVHRMLAWLSSTRGDVIGAWDELARECISFMRDRGLVSAVASAWNVDTDGTPQEILERVGVRLGKLLPGGGTDLVASGRAFIEALASGRLGRISLESPDSLIISGRNLC